MGFNEIEDGLAGSGSGERRIRELTEQLLRRGLAMTKASARQLAESMVATEQRVQQTFQERKERSTVYNDPRSLVREARAEAKRPGFGGASIGTMAAEYKKSSELLQSNGEGMRERALKPAPVTIPESAPDAPGPTMPAVKGLRDDMLVNEATAEEPAQESAAPEAAAPALETYEEEPAQERTAPAETGEEAPAAPADAAEETPAEEEGMLEETESVDAAAEAPAAEEDESIFSAEENVEEAPEESAAEEPADEPEEQPADDEAPEEPETDEEAAPEDAAEEQEPAEQEAASAEEPEEDAAKAPEEPAPEQPAEAPAKPREDLGKKHGVELTQMFNVNK